MIGIYHNKDLDGIASGAIMNFYAIRNNLPITLIGYDYGMPFDLSQISEDIVIMADVSLPMKDMVEVAKRSGWNFIWIDHHVSKFKEYNAFIEGNETFCRYIYSDQYSACEGVWRHFFPNISIPSVIKLLSEYDTWQNTNANHWENEVLPFQYGMKSLCNSVKNFPYYLFNDNSFITTIIEDGKTILQYNKFQNEFICQYSSFSAIFRGLKAICLNHSFPNSGVFDSIYNEKDYDIMIVFQHNGMFWRVSLYTTKDSIDCSEYAKELGGGGHKKAAGFQTKDLFSLIDIIK